MGGGPGSIPRRASGVFSERWGLRGELAEAKKGEVAKRKCENSFLELKKALIVCISFFTGDFL